MNFMHDQLGDKRFYRLFNVIDDYNREALGIEIDLSLPADRVIRSLEQIIEWRGKPEALRCDNGPEYISSKLTEWTEQKDIQLCHIQPGKPQQNAYIERFNREEVQHKATDWLWHYNNERPNMALGGITPKQKLIQAA